MSEPLLTKRLHVSGLTPSITPNDLERRLSSFGKVKAMDGFGALDALGDPKKFGFVTMEIGAKELAKCLNVLSGSTWKGAKLRIGEAKPDFRERLAQFNSQPPRPVRPQQTRTRNHGFPSSTLPLIPLSVTAAVSIPGWIATPSGRVVRPMRMRPERPMEPMYSELRSSKGKGLSDKRKKRFKPPPVRARRRLIDPTKWDSVYLKGVFLDAVPVPLPKNTPEPFARAMHESDEEDGETREENSTDSDAFSSVSLHQVGLSQVPSPQQPRKDAFVASSRIHEATESIGVHGDTSAALAMLGKIFGDKENWEGRESVDEMEDMSAVCSGREDEPDEEVAHDRDVEMEGNNPSTDFEVPESLQPAEPPPSTNLKTLFAPREDASFSLLDHLDLGLDLDLDADILGINAPPYTFQENSTQPILLIPNAVHIPATRSATKTRSRATLDSSLPLLFPTPDSHPHPYSSSHMATIRQHGTSACFLFPSETHVPGLHLLPPSSTFTRSSRDTSESIRNRWEKDKTMLTREWKNAWREARGIRKRVARAGGEVGSGY